MNDISKIDKNFQIQSNIGKDDVAFYNVLSEPFRVYGVFYEDGKFRRMPIEAARRVSPGVYSLHANTAGGRVCFKTDSPYVAINVKMANVGKMSHFALCGSSGFDLYLDGVYYRSFIPPFGITDGYESVIDIGAGAPTVREVMINMPLYSDVCEMHIGLSNKADILPPTPYRVEKPVVFYGSSVTQGGCASRPGTSYQGFLSRWHSFDYVNLGFSGNAHGQDEMADYIASLDMSVFVMDYDHNAPTKEHLEKTHERFFRRIRAAQPTLPIIFISMPKPYLSATELERLNIIKRTYERAVADGDRNVYLIDGRDLLSLVGAEGTVDFTHPTDLGFWSMAKTISKVIAPLL